MAIRTGGLEDGSIMAMKVDSSVKLTDFNLQRSGI